jgi:cytochrome c553
MKPLLSPVLSAFVACVTGLSALPALAQELKGDVKAGEKRAQMCIGCHGIPGYQASFPEVHRVPRISGQNAKYIVAALNAYAKGERRHPTMRGIAEGLTEQQIADLGAYYEQHGAPQSPPAARAAPEPSARVAELIKKGACISCHGEGFNKPIDASYPKVAGQYHDYLFVALRSYKIEGNDKVGRSNGVMAGIAKQFTNAELRELANYMGSIEGDLRVVPQSKFR